MFQKQFTDLGLNVNKIASTERFLLQQIHLKAERVHFEFQIESFTDRGLDGVR